MIRRLDVKFIFILIVTAVVPMIASLYFFKNAIRSSLSAGLNEDIATSLDSSLKAYRNYIEAQKDAQNIFIHSIGESKKIIDSCSAENLPAIKNSIEYFLNFKGYKKKKKKKIKVQSIKIILHNNQVLAANSEYAGQANTLKIKQNLTLNYGICKNLKVIFIVDSTTIKDFKKAAAYTETYNTLYHSQDSYLTRRIVTIYAMLLGLVLIISVWQGVLHTHKLTKRIHALSKATYQVAQGDLDVKVDPGRMDEAGELVTSFNRMVEDIRSSKASIEYLQKINAWQEIARRLAHEIKNPLTPIHLASQQIKSKYRMNDPSFEKLLNQSVEIIEEEVETLKRLVTDFSSFAKLPDIKSKKISPGKFISDCKLSFEYIKDQYNVDINWEIPHINSIVAIDTMLMKRVFNNLIQNAAQTLKETDIINPAIHIKTFLIDNNDRTKNIIISFKDNGPGVPEENRDTIFDPYYTTREEGTGLGLAICKKIVLEHHGKIELSKKYKNGAEFTISLPVLK